jgi:four helix bundle protein
MRYQTSLKERCFNLAAELLRAAPQIARAGPQQSHIAQQLFRAASSVGANLEEGEVALSRKDMAHKHALALREARETAYWLRMLAQAGESMEALGPLQREASEIVAMLTASVRKLRESQK